MLTHEQIASLVAARFPDMPPEGQAELVDGMLEFARDIAAMERAACEKIAAEKIEDTEPAPCPDCFPGCLVMHYRTIHRRRTAHEIETAIRNRNN